MKNLFLGLIATVMFCNLSYAQKSLCLKSSVTETEFKEMDEVSRKIASYIDSAVFALEGINLNEKNKTKIATVSLSLKENKLDNHIIIGDSDTTTPTENVQSCMICGINSGMACYRRIRTLLSNGTIVVTVEKVSDCIRLTWDDI